MDYHRSDIAGAENYFTRVLSNADRLERVAEIAELCAAGAGPTRFKSKRNTSVDASSIGAAT